MDSNNDDPLFYWKLCDELSVVDAAILIIGENPSQNVEVWDYKDNVRIYDKHGVPKTKQRRDYVELKPVMAALRTAILGNRLRAKISYPARGVKHDKPDLSILGEPVYHTVKLELGEHQEERVEFDHLVRCQSGEGRLHVGGPIDVVKGADELWVIKEPNWEQTTVEVDDLKHWLSGRGIRPRFFFPNSTTGGFDDKNGPRYSPKLACAVAAWQAVLRQQKNKSVKESLALWVQANGVQFGLGDESGLVPKKALDEISTVANWNTRGGATPTYIEDEAPVPEAVDNFDSAVQGNEDDDDEIPF